MLYILFYFFILVLLFSISMCNNKSLQLESKIYINLTFYLIPFNTVMNIVVINKMRLG